MTILIIIPRFLRRILMITFCWQMFARQRKTGRRGDRSKFNQFRSRENDETVSSLRDAIFLCPKTDEREREARRWRKVGEGGGSIFRCRSMDPYALVLGAIHPPIGPSSLRSVGETDRWVDTSPNVSCSALSSTLP